MSNGYYGRLIGRRKFIQLGAVAGASALLFGVAGCTPSPGKEVSGGEAPSYTPGSYTAKVKGKKSYVTVEATFSESAITDVKFVEHHETTRIADAAMNAIGKEIVDLQSLNIDTVSGATVTSMAILSAVKDCVGQAGGDAKALERGAEAEKSTGSETIEVDIAVIGAGGAGCPIAIEAARNGLKVAVFEKNGFIGGNMLVSDGRLYVPLTSVPDDARQEMTDPLHKYFADRMSLAREQGFDEEILNKIQSDYDAWYAAGNKTVFDSMEWYELSGAVEYGPDSYDYNYTSYNRDTGVCKWFYEDLNAELEKPIIGIAGYAYPRSSRVADTSCGEGLIDAMDDFIQKESMASIDFILSTPAKEILMENGKAVGVAGVCDNGMTYTVHASKAVVIATGGYGASKELLERFVPSMGFDKLETVPTVNPTWATGDGILLAEKVGAQVYNLDSTMLIPYAHPETHILDHIVGDTTNPLFVNTEGKRFTDETAYRTAMALAVKEQPDELAFVIASKQNAVISEYGRNFGGELVEPLIEFGMTYRADTLEDLASQVGLPFDALSKTIEKYNAQCESSETDEFGRSYFEVTAPITDGPYYASPITWGSLITYDGIVVDESSAVLDTDNKPIPNLYALGEVNGNGGLYTSGTSVQWTRALLGIE